MNLFILSIFITLGGCLIRDKSTPPLTVESSVIKKIVFNQEYQFLKSPPSDRATELSSLGVGIPLTRQWLNFIFVNRLFERHQLNRIPTLNAIEITNPFQDSTALKHPVLVTPFNFERIFLPSQKRWILDLSSELSSVRKENTIYLEQPINLPKGIKDWTYRLIISDPESTRVYFLSHLYEIESILENENARNYFEIKPTSISLGDTLVYYSPDLTPPLFGYPYFKSKTLKRGENQSILMDKSPYQTFLEINHFPITINGFVEKEGKDYIYDNNNLVGVCRGHLREKAPQLNQVKLLSEEDYSNSFILKINDSSLRLSDINWDSSRLSIQDEIITQYLIFSSQNEPWEIKPAPWSEEETRILGFYHYHQCPQHRNRLSQNATPLYSDFKSEIKWATYGPPHLPVE